MTGWGLAAWLMLGGSTMLLFIGMPVAFTFITVNIVGAYLYMGGEAGLAQLARSSVSSVTAFSLTPIPLFVLMAELMHQGGMARQVFNAANKLIGSTRVWWVDTETTANNTRNKTDMMLEGVAFISGRIRQKLDDELPEVTHALLGTFFLLPLITWVIIATTKLGESSCRPSLC